MHSNSTSACTVFGVSTMCVHSNSTSACTVFGFSTVYMHSNSTSACTVFGVSTMCVHSNIVQFLKEKYWVFRYKVDKSTKVLRSIS